MELSDDMNYLKSDGEKIIINLDNCEIKENNYSTDITKRGLSKFEIAYSGYKEDFIEQSVIIFYRKIGDVTEKYISQPFPLNTITLEFHILKNAIILYIDRHDRNKYLFEFVKKA